jgi:repressor LexA
MKTKPGRLSYKQRSIIDFINRFWRERNYPPSIRDIVSGCGLSSTSVADYNLKILERQGYIRRHREVSRGIELPSDARAASRGIYVPVIGAIAAGEPIPVPDTGTWDVTAISDTIEVTGDLIRGREGVYALKVKGTSMVDALINDGDIVLMQYANAAENGEMVAVWLKSEREVTLKKFYLEKDRVRLQPANRRMKAIFADPDDIEIQGKVVAVIRRLD